MAYRPKYETDPNKIANTKTLGGGLKGLVGAAAGALGNTTGRALSVGSNADKPFEDYWKHPVSQQRYKQDVAKVQPTPVAPKAIVRPDNDMPFGVDPPGQVSSNPAVRKPLPTVTKAPYIDKVGRMGSSTNPIVYQPTYEERPQEKPAIEQPEYINPLHLAAMGINGATNMSGIMAGIGAANMGANSENAHAQKAYENKMALEKQTADIDYQNAVKGKVGAETKKLGLENEYAPDVHRAALAKSIADTNKTNTEANNAGTKEDAARERVYASMWKEAYKTDPDNADLIASQAVAQWEKRPGQNFADSSLKDYDPTSKTETALNLRGYVEPQNAKRVNALIQQYQAGYKDLVDASKKGFMGINTVDKSVLQSKRQALQNTLMQLRDAGLYKSNAALPIGAD